MSDTTTKERPFNATADEVIAIRDGRMTMFRRPVEPQPDWGRYEITQPWHVSAFDVGGRDHRNPFGEVGDRLYVREAWNITHVNQLAPDEVVAKKAEECVRDNHGFACPCADGMVYKADGVTEHPEYGKALWRPSSQMSRWASRDTLEITDVRVERLQEITYDDVLAEGVRDCPVCGGIGFYEGGGDVRDCVGCQVGEVSYAEEEFRRLWDARYANPKPVRSSGIITHYVSYPWDDVQEIREHRGKEWRVMGNCWVFVNTFRRVEG